MSSKIKITATTRRKSQQKYLYCALFLCVFKAWIHIRKIDIFVFALVFQAVNFRCVISTFGRHILIFLAAAFAAPAIKIELIFTITVFYSYRQHKAVSAIKNSGIITGAELELVIM